MSKFFNFKKKKLIYFLLLILAIDLVTKFLVVQYFIQGEILSLIPSINLRYVRNYGAAFNFLSGNGWKRWLLIGIDIIVCIKLLITIFRSDESIKFSDVAYILITGGALGNLFDRIWYGFVIDMIDIYIGSWHFATFNFADSVIFIGVLITFIEIFFQKKSKI